MSTGVWLAAPDETVYLEEALEWDADPRTIKLGGSPSWLHEEKVNAPEPVCEACQAPMVLVTQANAPVGKFDRILYVFGCKSGKCASSWVALRASMPLPKAEPKSQSYTQFLGDCGPKLSGDDDACFEEMDWEDEEEDSVKEIQGAFQECSFEDTDDWDDAAEPTPVVDAPKAAKQESKTKTSSQAQSSKATISTATTTSSATVAPTAFASSSSAFRPICLDVFEEPKESKQAKKEVEKIQKQVKTGAVSVENDGEEDNYEKNHEDKQFKKFSKKMEKYPKQCLRWCFDGEPVPIQAENPPPLSQFSGAPNVPDCSCGSPRTFELQLIPTVIYYLQHYWDSWDEWEKKGKKDKSATDSKDKGTTAISLEEESGISFGGVYVYTCTGHCSQGEYAQEYVHVQAEV